MKMGKVMNRRGVMWLAILLAVMMLFTACGNDEATQDNQVQQQEAQQTPTEQRQTENEQPNAVDAAGAEVQKDTEATKLQGMFQGLADGHSAEINVNEETIVYQFYDEEIAAKFDIMEVGTAIQFEVTEDTETGMQVITKLEEVSSEQ